MNEGAGHVMKTGILPEEADVEHHGNPGQRVPVRKLEGGPGPFEVFPGKAFENTVIGVNVVRVVVGDEIVANGLAVDKKHGHDEYSGHPIVGVFQQTLLKLAQHDE